MRGKHPRFLLFGQKEMVFLVLPVEFSSTFLLSLKEDQFQKKVNRRQEVKRGMLNSPRPRLRRAKVGLFISLFIILDLVKLRCLDGFIGKEYHHGPSFLVFFFFSSLNENCIWKLS